jgi:hypothetical protein
MKDNDETQVFEIRVKAKYKLSKDEMWLIAEDFHKRLQGHTTECPKQLIGAEIGLLPLTD